MAINDAGLCEATDGLAAVIGYLSLHTAAPNSSGSNESTAARVAVTWGAATGSGDAAMTGGTRNFTGGAASGPCTHVGYWSAPSGGTFYGSAANTGDQTFNSAGEYSVTAATLNATAT